MMRSTGCVLALLASLTLTASSDADAVGGSGDFRQTEEFGRRFVEAVNSPDADFRLGVAREVFSKQTLRGKGEGRLVELMQRIASQLGTLEFHHAEVSTLAIGASTRHSMHLFVRSIGDARWKDLQFRLDSDPPHRIAELVFIADVAEPVRLPNGPVTAPHVIDWRSGDRPAGAESDPGAGPV